MHVEQTCNHSGCSDCARTDTKLLPDVVTEVRVDGTKVEVRLWFFVSWCLDKKVADTSFVASWNGQQIAAATKRCQHRLNDAGGGNCTYACVKRATARSQNVGCCLDGGRMARRDRTVGGQWLGARPAGSD